MAELADAPDSKSGSRKRVGVRPSLWAPLVHIVSAGLTRIFCGSVAIELCANLNHITQAYPPVDMSEWVAYSPRPRVMKKLHSHDVGPILVFVISRHSLILAKEAAHA